MPITTNKELYHNLCEREDLDIPLFQQFWWLEAVTSLGKRWEVVLSYDKKGAVSAALPFLLGSKLGVRYILQPQLSQFGGPYYCPSVARLGDAQRLPAEQYAANQLIDQLHALHPLFYQQSFSPSVTNWLPFYWRGFHQTTRYTYRLNDLSEPDRLFRAFNRNERQRRIRRLISQCHCVDLSPNAFALFQDQCRRQAAQRNLLPSALVEHVCAAALRRRQGLVLGLTDNGGTLMAALFSPFDRHAGYFLVPALDSAYKNEGAMETLVWLTIQRLSSLTHAYDFEGSMSPGIERFYRSFGAVQTPYFALSKWLL